MSEIQGRVNKPRDTNNMHVHTYVQTHTWSHSHIHAHMHTHRHTDTDTDTHTDTHTHTHTHAHTTHTSHTQTTYLMSYFYRLNVTLDLVECQVHYIILLLCCSYKHYADLTLSFMNARLLDDVSFHPCIRYKRWEVRGLSLSFLLLYVNIAVGRESYLICTT